MTNSYENVESERVNRITAIRHHRRSARVAAIVSAVTCGLLITIMYVRSVRFGTDDSEFSTEPLTPSNYQAVPIPSPMDPVSVEPENESRYVIYDIQIPEDLQHYTQDVCEEYGVSYPLVIAIMKKESEFLPDAVSATNDYGIMQINGGNHEWLEKTLGVTDWFDPRQNILAGIYILSQFNEYEDVHQILMSYNCGPSGAKKLWAEGVYHTAYSRSVVEILDGLEVIKDE